MKSTIQFITMLSIPCLIGCTKADPLFDQAIPYENLRYDAGVLPGLPEPVQRYFRFALRDGQPYVNYLRLKHSGTFKTSRDSPWMDIRGEQYFTANPPGFLWIGRTSKFKAMDSFVAGEGHLSVYLFGWIRIVKEGGDKIGQAEPLRWLGECVWMPTSLLPDESKRWSPIDEHSARLTLSFQGQSVYYDFTFSEKGPIIRLDTERFMGETLMPWRGEVRNYCLQNGMMVPADIEGSWLMEDGKHTYARFHVEEFTYDKPGKY